jgi:hypothetical protein
VVDAEDLPPEDPQHDQWGEDAVPPAAEGGQGLGEDLFDQDVGERQIAVLKELPSQGTDLFAERGGVARVHAGDSLPVRE